MINASCDCGAVKLEIAEPPEDITDCNCSICRKLGTLWAYYHPDKIKRSGETSIYIRGDRMLEFHRCKTCGCTIFWEGIDKTEDRMGINARLIDPPSILNGLRVRHLDGAETWNVLAWTTYPAYAGTSTSK